MVAPKAFSLLKGPVIRHTRTAPAGKEMLPIQRAAAPLWRVRGLPKCGVHRDLDSAYGCGYLGNRIFREYSEENLIRVVPESRTRCSLTR